MKNPSFATRWNADVIDEFYARWQRDPDSIDPVWNAFFEGFQLAWSGNGNGHGATATALKPAPQALPADIVNTTEAGPGSRRNLCVCSIGHTRPASTPCSRARRRTASSDGQSWFHEADLDYEFERHNTWGA
jgi:2-oxoglutarate dehydrogenase complex dehydrogenase (E1) component-like enzyme